MFVHLLRIERAGATTDRYGNTVKNWAAASSDELFGWVTQTGSSEIGDQREGQVSTWRAFMPAGTDIAGADRVVWVGEDADTTFEVVGPPARPWAPRSGEHHVEVDLRVVEG